MTKRELLEKIGGTEGGVAMDAEILFDDEINPRYAIGEVRVENYSAGPIVFASLRLSTPPGAPNPPKPKEHGPIG